MALWLVRAGKHGELEKKFLDEGRVYLTWGGLSHDLSNINTKGQLRSLLERVYPEAPAGRITNNLGQIWAFSKSIAKGDWAILPSKKKPAIHIAEVLGDYVFEGGAEDPYYHHRDVRWIAQDIPRSNFDQDILYSLGAFMTVCQISRNDAELRVKAMANNSWRSTMKKAAAGSSTPTPPDGGEPEADLAELAKDQLAKFIIARFKGHGLERLVDAVLRAQGYETYRGAEGPDKGVDILAAPGPMGFGEPRICVQVKSGDAPLDRPTLDQLIGVMQNFQASHGLLVSWGGFKSSVDKEEASQFFRVRLWDQGDLIDQVLANYSRLDESIRAELPLKPVWVVAGINEN